jgi:hypothetical protein
MLRIKIVSGAHMFTWERSSYRKSRTGARYRERTEGAIYSTNKSIVQVLSSPLRPRHGTDGTELKH